MKFAALRYELGPSSKSFLGRGGYSNVYKATQLGSTGGLVAIKKSRVSIRVKRPMLQHESRVLQLLRGHPVIPVLYGYGRLEHFEYLAMELLGPSLAQLKKDNAGVALETVLRVVDQMLAGLQHIHSFGIVHRDIKPENLLCVLDNSASTIKIIDFGIAKSFSRVGPPSKYDPLKYRRHIVGSLYWASLNSHNGLDLSPCDDLESSALVALYLLRGSLPWKPRPRLDPPLWSQEIVRIMKSGCSGLMLSKGFPDEFGELLDYSRSLPFDHLPDYMTLRHGFVGLAARIGCSLNEGSLDWQPCYPTITNTILDDPQVSIPYEEDQEEDSDSDLGDDSYFGYDIADFERQGERDKDVTLLLPFMQKVELDGTILPIDRVTGH